MFYLLYMFNSKDLSTNVFLYNLYNKRKNRHIGTDKTVNISSGKIGINQMIGEWGEVCDVSEVCDASVVSKVSEVCEIGEECKDDEWGKWGKWGKCGEWDEGEEGQIRYDDNNLYICTQSSIEFGQRAIWKVHLCKLHFVRNKSMKRTINTNTLEVNKVHNVI